MSAITASRVSVQDALVKSFRQIRKNGVRARINVGGCCRSCIVSEFDDDIQIVWNYGGQGGRIFWDYRGTPMYGDGSKMNVIYLNHDLTPDNAEMVINTLRSNGLDVEWDGAMESCIQIHAR